MPETVISIVSYPLAPRNAAPVTFPWLLKLYRHLVQEAEEEGVRLIFAGDSSGGNIVLGLVLEALREDEQTKASFEEQDKHIPHPVAVMAISPSTDLTRSNPEIEKIAPLDPILTPDFVKTTAKAWKGDWDATDSRISPINADVSLLAKRGIHVHGVTGGFDILAPDAIVFRNLLEKERVSGEWLEWEKQMHCFVLTWPYGLREGREGVGWIVDVLKKE
jgi:acetyl esterase/lipase